ncbi:DUF6285 domain-containing protein [Myxococcota bacterium]|nr:DUF6285 domain-containing protein [Myxococcota bacterium]
MRPPPDAVAVLAAVATFLAKELRVEDPAQAFRVKVAAHLLGGVARGLKVGEALDEQALGLLALLLGEDAPEGPVHTEERARRLHDQQARLSARLLAGEIAPDDETVLQGLRALLASELALSNPRFDLDDQVGEL